MQDPDLVQLFQGLTERLESIDRSQQTHNHLLDEHSRRSAALEASLELLRAEVKPLTMHVVVFTAIFKGTAMAGAGLIAALGAVATVKTLLGH